MLLTTVECDSGDESCTTLRVVTNGRGEKELGIANYDPDEGHTVTVHLKKESVHTLALAIINYLELTE